MCEVPTTQKQCALSSSGINSKIENIASGAQLKTTSSLSVYKPAKTLGEQSEVFYISFYVSPSSKRRSLSS